MACFSRGKDIFLHWVFLILIDIFKYHCLSKEWYPQHTSPSLYKATLWVQSGSTHSGKEKLFPDKDHELSWNWFSSSWPSTQALKAALVFVSPKSPTDHKALHNVDPANHSRPIPPHLACYSPNSSCLGNSLSAFCCGFLCPELTATSLTSPLPPTLANSYCFFYLILNATSLGMSSLPLPFLQD